jgi:DNA invertase Pin-like site-specific DNA recombinase
MLIGYARVSTSDQKLNLQRDALKAAGCTRIFVDRGVSGATNQRPGLARALAFLKPGYTLIVWKLDRLGRSLAHLVHTIAELGERGVNFRSLSDPIATESAGGRLILHIMAALAEFERSLNSERTRAGLEAAKRRGQAGSEAFSYGKADCPRSTLDRSGPVTAEGGPPFVRGAVNPLSGPCALTPVWTQIQFRAIVIRSSFGRMACRKRVVYRTSRSL